MHFGCRYIVASTHRKWIHNLIALSIKGGGQPVPNKPHFMGSEGGKRGKKSFRSYTSEWLLNSAITIAGKPWTHKKSEFECVSWVK